MSLADLFVALAQAILVGAGAPLLVGLIRTAKARLQGRRGASPLQPYRDLRKLVAKEAVVSENASWIFRTTPFLLAAIMLVIALVVPLLVTRPAFGFAGNIVLVMYLLLASTFFLALAGLDTGSAFGGMGSSREEKWLVARPRPTLAPYGFPSGHALGAVVFYGGLAYLWWTADPGRRPRWAGAVAAALAVIAIAASRLYLDEHWLTDVVGGLAAGAAYLLADIWAFERWRRPRSALSAEPRDEPGASRLRS